MKPLETIYWLRLALGVTAALICVAYGLATGTISSIDFTSNTFLTGISFALIVYMLSYYIIKFRFINKVEKTRKLITTGIGIYFLAWIVFWILMYTIIAGSP